MRGVRRTLDPRTHAYRPDLADASLAAQVIAAHYADPLRLACSVEQVAVRGTASAAAPAVSELLCGESFHALELGESWAWGWCSHDRYVGYVPASALAPAADEATHRVSARLALAFAEPSIKSPVTARLPLGAMLHAAAEDGAFLSTAMGFIHRRHLGGAGEHAGDPVEVAARLLGAPYGWGGRSEHGVDCSGLVQLALMFCGIDCPRDSDQQFAALGRPVGSAELTRGDLVFFPGHVGMMVDGNRLLHANAHWMATVIEPLADVVDRLRPAYAEPVLGARRL